MRPLKPNQWHEIYWKAHNQQKHKSKKCSKNKNQTYFTSIKIFLMNVKLIFFSKKVFNLSTRLIFLSPTYLSPCNVEFSKYSFKFSRQSTFILFLMSFSIFFKFELVLFFLLLIKLSSILVEDILCSWS